jgi:hypothetical protein
VSHLVGRGQQSWVECWEGREAEAVVRCREPQRRHVYIGCYPARLQRGCYRRAVTRQHHSCRCEHCCQTFNHLLKHIDSLLCHWWIGMDVKGNACIVIWVIYWHLSGGTGESNEKASIYIYKAGLLVVNWNRNLPSKGQDWRPLYSEFLCFWDKK